MKNKMLILLILSLNINLTTKAQDTLNFGRGKPVYYITDSTKTLINVVFKKSNIDDTLKVNFINKYTAITLLAYDDSLSKKQTKKIIFKWLQLMKNHEHEIIDTNYISKNHLKDDTLLLAFFTYPYKDYLLVEFYETIKYHGYKGSAIVGNKRLQILYNNNLTSKLVIVKTKEFCKQNKLLFLE